MTPFQDKARGSLVGGAIGDALGYVVEFDRHSRIVSKYGPEGIGTFELNGSGLAEISDDTQMTLFTAAAMIEGAGCGLERPEACVEGAYLDWYYTQTGRAAKGAAPFTTLRELPELAHRRAPGGTCLSACESLLQGRKPDNRSNGCGGIMRAAPVGLSYSQRQGASEQEVIDAGAYVGRVTHLHPLGFLPAGMLAYTVFRLARPDFGDVIEDVVEDGLRLMHRVDGDAHALEKAQLERITRRAMALAASDASDLDAIRRLGEGWVGEEAWAIALYCALRHRDSFADAIRAAVNHDGDSDSTGSICGNILGTLIGYDALRRERPFCPEGRTLEDTLELHPLLLDHADRL